MNCPSCNKILETRNEFGIEIDVCLNGCGGVWFDANELDKLDETNEKISTESLLAGTSQNTVVVDRAKIKNCPKCVGVKLSRICEYLDNDLEIDSCPNCHGVWLDPGELNTIREINENKQTREKTFNEFSKQASNSSRVKAVLGLIFK